MSRPLRALILILFVSACGSSNFAPPKNLDTPSVGDGDPVISPDFKYLSYYRSSSGGLREIRIVDLASGDDSFLVDRDALDCRR